MKTQKIIKDAMWSGDEKGIDFTLFDQESKESKRMNIEVGNEIWEDEIQDKAKEIIINQLSDVEIVNKDFSIM